MEMKMPKLNKKILLVFGALLLIAGVAGPVLAWVASNTLSFTTTVSGSPFRLDVTDSHGNPLSPPYLPATMYYEDPVILNTTTTNMAGVAYDNVKTNYEIWRADGASMTYDQSLPWLYVEVKDISGTPDIILTTAGSGYSNFGLISDTTISATADNALLAYIGPYTASANFVAIANVTVTFHNSAASTTYDAKVWVSVG